jgi:hypothetical protein
MIKRFSTLSLGLFILGASWILALFSASESKAALVTYQFSGNIGQVSGSLFTPTGLGANGFNAGLKMSGTYTFDTATAGLLPSGLGIQMYSGSVTNLNLSVGNYAAVLQGGGTNVTTLSNAATSLYSVNLGTAGNLVKGLAPSLFSMNLADETGTAFSSVNLPGKPAPDLASFNVNQWKLVFSNGGQLVGSLDSLKAVPLPATALLFGAGLIGLVGLGSRGRLAGSLSKE